MAVVLYQRKNGLSALACFSIHASAAVVISSSTVSIRFLVSGPVSTIVCFPTRPKRGSTVASSTSVALQCSTPRGPNICLNLGILGIVGQFGFFFGVEVIEVAEELVEAVNGRQKLVAVAQMVLAELAGGVALRLQHFGDRRVFRLQPDGSAGHPDLGEAGANRVLPGDEAGAAGGAALLRVIVGEQAAFVGDAVDVGRAVSHHAVAETC